MEGLLGYCIKGSRRLHEGKYLVPTRKEDDSSKLDCTSRPTLAAGTGGYPSFGGFLALQFL